MIYPIWELTRRGGEKSMINKQLRLCCFEFFYVFADLILYGFRAGVVQGLRDYELVLQRVGPDITKE